ncbi:MAG: hypothetical protein HND44_22120 [Chloroflexi bacterium]|nr:hypothetical protein [Ardenticatenaceae bacterium]MBL1131140.1 hypothetical protein [Chloroflexota bacterium]NOG37239.1 hypothetical protein [Chloroflexota bacterium]
MTPETRSRLLNILVPFSLSILAVFVTLEVAFRLFYQLIPMEVCAADHIIGTYYCQPYFEYDKPIRYGYKYIPGFRLEGMWDPANPFLANSENSTAPTPRDDAFPYLFETDDMGFPNKPGPWQDNYNIVIAGDSFTIRTAPQTWMELLAEQTGSDILTLGAPSWSTLNEVEAIKQFGLDKNPEWVLLMFFEGNDLVNTGQYLERRDSGLNWREFDMQDVSLRRRLLTPHFARYLWDKLFPGEETAPVKYRYPVAASTEVGEIETVFKEVHLLPLSADYETLARSDEFAAMKEGLLELQALTEAQGARLVVVYIPSKEHVLWSRVWDEVDVNNVLERTVTVRLSEGDHGRLLFDPIYLSYDQFTANQRAQEQLLSDFTAEVGIEFLNLTPIFWQKSIETGELYHFADPHWNQAGNQLAADAIATFLREIKQ